MTKVTGMVVATHTMIVREYFSESQAREYADMLAKSNTVYDVKVYTNV